MQSLVTGANRGIGLELVRQLLAKGCSVIATARNPQESEELQNLKSSHQTLEIYPLDVSKSESIEQLKNTLRSQIQSLDFLIHNAGVLIDGEASFSSLSLNSLKQSFDVNVWGPLQLTQALFPLLEKARPGVVVHISSQMGSVGDNSSGGYYAYRMSKSALNMLAKNLSLESPEILSYCFHPGWVQTRMGGPNAKITTEESVQGILSLVLSKDPRWSGRFLNYKGAELPW